MDDLISRQEKNVPDTNVGELISKQAAIDEIRKCRFVVDAIEKIRKLPSAEPAPCEFCKHNNIADDKVCLMCSAERRADEVD